MFGSYGASVILVRCLNNILLLRGLIFSLETLINKGMCYIWGEHWGGILDFIVYEC